MQKKLLLAAAISTVLTFSATASETSLTPVPHKKSAAGRIMNANRYHHLSFTDLGNEYTNFKDFLQKKYGLSYSLTASFTPQYGAPSGKSTAFQTIVYPAITWEMFNNKYGQMTLNAAYNVTRYSGADGQKIQNNINVVTPINDYSTQSNEFPELFITYQLPNEYNWLTIGAGQFPLYNFDGTSYDSNQQQYFINYAFSQNATSSYSTAGLGSYLQITPNQDWSFALGFQDATNITGDRISTSNLDKKHFTTFGYISYSPTISGLGDGQYTFLYYNQPWVEDQPQTTNGWSINASQNVGDKWSLFGRINGVSKDVEEIDNSYVLGAVMNNPFDRNPLDQIGLSFGLNHINEDAVGEDLEHNWEKVLEGYVTFGVSKWMAITPDVQVYFDPALSPKSDNAFVFSLRATVFF
ncbi:MAG: carbohydrate porin [Alphaproteobacteria bacterium]|nr:carbohydrate porin [Alphaproteobacteria bacterium]